MPELPEVETTMRALAARLRGRRILRLERRVDRLREPLPADLERKVNGRRMVEFARRAKYIIIHLDETESLLLHLGMSGRLLFDGPPRGRHEHLTFHCEGGTVLRFVDPRRFGLLLLAERSGLATHPRLAGLGVEPLSPAFDGALLHRRFAGRRSDVKAALLDQRLVAGVGNIYACEALFRAGISPRRRAGGLGRRRCERLARAIVAVLEEAIAAGGSSLRDYVDADGRAGNFQNEFRVYGREGEPCPGCGTPVRRIVQGGRSTFFCTRCQR